MATAPSFLPLAETTSRAGDAQAGTHAFGESQTQLGKIAQAIGLQTTDCGLGMTIPHLPDRRGASDSKGRTVDNHGEPPDDGGMEARVAKLELDVAAIKIDVAVIKANGATKSDLAELRAELKTDIADLGTSIADAKASIILWVVSAIFIAQLLPVMLRKLGM